MRKKILLTLAMALVLSLVFAFTVFADDASVHNGKVDLDAKVTLDDGKECALFDENGEALTWYISGKDENGNNIYSSIRSDDPQVIYFSETWCEVTSVRIDLKNPETGEITKISSGNFVVINWMDDDVLINECKEAKHIGKPVTGFKLMFQGNKTLEYAYLRLDTTNIQRQNFNGCSKLKYINLENLTKLVRIGDSQNFSNCTSLFKDQILDLSKTSLTSIDNGGSFNGVPLKGIIFPSTLKSISSWTFQGSRFEVFTWPTTVNKIESSMFKNNSTLTTLYLMNNVASIDEKTFEGVSSLEKIFFVGTKDELLTLIQNTSTTNNGAFFEVVGENNKNLISYSDYLALEDKSGKYAIYNYSYCEAYNEGKHVFTGNAVMQEVDYFKGVFFADTCTVENCGLNVIDETRTIDALFVDYGYSATLGEINGSCAVSQFFGINKGAIEQYRALNPDFEFGFVVSTYADPFGEIAMDSTLSDKIFVTEEKFLAYDYASISISGIAGENLTKGLSFCMFVKDGEKTLYLDNGKTVTNVELKSYSEIFALLENK